MNEINILQSSSETTADSPGLFLDFSQYTHSVCWICLYSIC